MLIIELLLAPPPPPRAAYVTCDVPVSVAWAHWTETELVCGVAFCFRTYVYSWMLDRAVYAYSVVVLLYVCRYVCMMNK